MPRAQQSPISRIVGFFRTAPKEIAELTLGLCKDAVAERQALGAKIRAAQTKGKSKGKRQAAAPAATSQVAEANQAVEAATDSAVAQPAKRRGGRPKRQPAEGQLPIAEGSQDVPGDVAVPEGELVGAEG